MTKPRSPQERGFVVEQLEFADVVESEVIAGDAEYTAWIAAGRPSRSTTTDMAVVRDAGVGE